MPYVISDDCLSCGSCQFVCENDAIFEGDYHYQIDPDKCKECGECAKQCPAEAISKA